MRAAVRLAKTLRHIERARGVMEDLFRDYESNIHKQDLDDITLDRALLAIDSDLRRHEETMRGLLAWRKKVEKK
jgi:hypothetical protein